MQQGSGPRHSTAGDAAVPGRPDLLGPRMQKGGGGGGGESSGAGVQQGRGPCPRNQRCSGVGVDPLQATPQPTPGMPAAAPQWCCTRRGGVSSGAFPGLC